MRWAARLFTKAFASSSRPVKRRRPLSPELLESRETPTVSGLVFVDLNQDGTQDAGEVGVPGVVVTGTLADNTTVTDTTDANGAYSLDTQATALRVQFSSIPEGLLVGRSAATGSTVRFVDASTDPTDVNLGLNSYLLVLNTYFFDKATTGVAAGEGAIVTVEYAADGTQSPTTVATNDQVGSTFGLSYHSQSNSIYASSFVKRHAGLGPNTLDPNATTIGTTTGGIYRIDRTNGNTVSLLLDMNAVPTAIVPSGSTAASFGTGADPHPADADIDGGDWLHDPTTAQFVGKRGLGGMALSADGRTMYTINLATRELIEVPLNVDGTLDTTRDLRRTPVPLTNPGGITNFNSGDVRPFAVTVRGNAVFVGVTYTAQSQSGAGAAANLRAIVYAFDPASGAFRSYNGSTSTFGTGSTPVISAPLNYTRGTLDEADPNVTTDNVSANWRPWTDAFVNQDATSTEPKFSNPQPWLTDIVFDGTNMVLGLRDRFGDMGGFQTYSTDTNSTDPVDTYAAGDILRAALAGTGDWTLEANGASGGVTTGGAGNNQGPGGGEFYYQDNFGTANQEVTTGGLAQVPGYQSLVSTGIDVSDLASGGVYTFLNSDTDTSPTVNTAGTTFARGQTYISADFTTFGSANGVGNVEAIPAEVGTSAGDRIFNDANNNGIQDPAEIGIAGVTVQLFRSGGTTALTSVVTDSTGNFAFTNLDPNSAYEFRIARTQTALTNLTLSPSAQGTNAGIDSNGTAADAQASTPVVVAFTTGAAGTSDYSLDVGFAGATATGQLTLGNQVFVDTNNNGTLDNGETGLAGVSVQLISSTGTILLTTTTAANGIYTFTGLDAGSYRVRLAASNFNTGSVLAGYTSSTGTGGAFEGTNPPDPNLNANNDDNGITDITAGALGAGGFIQSNLIALTVGGEPTDDGDTNNNTNLTLDFGVVPPAATGTLSLGNTVFNDVNNNGTLDNGEGGIAGVSVQLISSTGTVLQTAQTVAGGQYTFTGLAPGSYRVRLADTNFNTGGVLVGFTSSTGTTNEYENTTTPLDPNNNIDGDDNGVTDITAGALGAGGFIQSPLIDLALGAEPTNDGDTDNNTNLTLDFGVRQAPVANTLTLGNQVFVDANNNGTLDNGETGLVGVTVQLITGTGAGTVAATTVTGTNGIYTFANLQPGTYRVRLAASNFNTGNVLAGYTSSTGTGGAFEGTNPPDPNLNANNDDNGITDITAGALGAGGFIQSNPITLALGDEPINDGDTDNNTNLTLDFGVVAPTTAGTLSLGNTIFNDLNNNGLQDSGEAGIASVNVDLVNSAGAVVTSAQTDSNGQYTFTGLAAGNYRVRLAATNFTGTGALVGFTSSTGTNGSATGTYEGASPVDPNNNVNGDDNGVIISTAGALGSGGFIESGVISLAVGAEPTNDGDNSADTNLSLDFGVFRNFSIGNQVFNDLDNNGTRNGTETGIQGVTVRLLSAATGNPVIATTTTAANGLYLFSNLVAGDYIVELAAANFNTGSVLAGFQSSTGGTGNTFEGANTPDPDTVATDGDDNGTTITTAGALGAGGVIRTGTVTLGPTGTEPTAETPTNDTTTVDNQSNLTVDLGVFSNTPTTAGVSGRVFLDYNNNGDFNGPDVGINNVTITLSGGNLTTPLTTVTDANGNFSFSNLAAGTYTITQTQPTTPANQTGRNTAGTAGGNVTVANVISNIVLGATTQATNYRFAEVPLISTGGSVYEDTNNNGVKDTGEAGISGVQIQLTGTNVVTGAITPVNVTTDTNGDYTFANILPGTYTITQTQQPTGFTDGQEQNGTPAGTVGSDRFTGINLTNSAATSGGFNFGEIRTGSLSGVVFADANNNGTQDTGETGISGVTLTLTATIAGQNIRRTATTGENGSYTFTNLNPGTYTITQTQPTNYANGIETPGTSGGTSTIDNVISGITLASGATATGYNFGEVLAPDISITQTQTPSRPKAGALVTLTYTVRNIGSGTADDVTANINLNGLTFVSVDGDGYDNTTRVWTVGDVAAGATQTLTIVARVPANNRYRPSASVSASNDLSSTNNASVGTVNAGLGISMQSFLSSSIRQLRRS